MRLWQIGNCIFKYQLSNTIEIIEHILQSSIKNVIVGYMK